MEQNTNHSANDDYSNKNDIGNKLKIEINNNSISWRWGGGISKSFIIPFIHQSHSRTVAQSHSRTGLSSYRAEVALQYSQCIK